MKPLGTWDTWGVVSGCPMAPIASSSPVACSTVSPLNRAPLFFIHLFCLLASHLLPRLPHGIVLISIRIPHSPLNPLHTRALTPCNAHTPFSPPFSLLLFFSRTILLSPSYRPCHVLESLINNHGDHTGPGPSTFTRCCRFRSMSSLSNRLSPFCEQCR